MKNWQAILKIHDCEMTIIDDNKVIIHNKAYTIKEIPNGPKKFVYLDIAIIHTEDGYTVITEGFDEVDHYSSIFEWLGY